MAGRKENTKISSKIDLMISWLVHSEEVLDRFASRQKPVALFFCLRLDHKKCTDSSGLARDLNKFICLLIHQVLAGHLNLLVRQLILWFKERFSYSPYSL